MKKRRPLPVTYSLLEIISASPTEPLPEGMRRRHIAIIRAGLEAMATDPHPVAAHWQAVASAANMVEALIELKVLEDVEGHHLKAALGLRLAGERFVHDRTKPLRLDGPGLTSARHLVEDYAEVVEHISHRDMLRAFNAVERTVNLLHGKEHIKRALFRRF